MANALASDTVLHEEEDDQLITGEAVALDLHPTGFVLRAAGAIIDWLVYFVGGILLLAFVVLPLANAVFGDDAAAMGAVSIAGLVFVLIVAPTTVELLSRGKSLGKLAVGARIVRDDGGAIGFRHAFIRALTALLEIYITFGGFAAIVALLNSRSRRMGDLLAGTYSRYERVSQYVPPVYGVPTELVSWAATADVARMPDRLGRRLSQFLRQATAMSPAARDRLSRELAAEASAWVSPIPPANAELFIAAIVALRRERDSVALQLQQEQLTRLDPALRGLPHDFPDRA